MIIIYIVAYWYATDDCRIHETFSFAATEVIIS